MSGKEERCGDTRRQSFESFGLIAGGLAHDYNNMLTAMLGNIDIILCEDISPSVRETATDIKTTMLKAATLVRRMLSYASSSEPQPEPIDCNVLVRDIVRIMKRAIPENAVVSIANPVKIPFVMADAAMLWQLVMNLVVNGADSLEGRTGIVKISVFPRKSGNADLEGFIWPGKETAVEGDFVAIEVSDSGCGMTEETRKRIFEPLFTTKESGNGLGLASVMAIVSSMGGAIGVESEPGRGSRFTVLLPAGQAVEEAGFGDDCAQSMEETAAKQVDAGQGRGRAAPGGKAVVLVVDDDKSIVRLLKIILEKSGRYEVLSATSGDEGLEVYRGNPQTDLCLIDASMGAGMSGLDLCGAIRSENASIPLVLMSAYKAKEMSSRMSQCGVTAFLAKPFRGTDVLDACMRHLGR